jgi:hypothetical protein
MNRSTGTRPLLDELMQLEGFSKNKIKLFVLKIWYFRVLENQRMKIG